MNLKSIYDVIVIGAGAAGLMAAIKASESGKKVLLIEKNSTAGNKLSITGGGRCNILNAEEDVHALLKNYKKSSQYLYSAFSEFGMADTKEFFETRGMKIKVEDRKRAFPVSEKAADVVSLLLKEAKRNGVVIKTSEPIVKISVLNASVSSIKTQKQEYTATSYILATGGMSHPETGSTGDGFNLLKEVGHSVNTPTPTIVPVTVSDSWVKQAAGKTLSNVKMTFMNKQKKVSKFGNVLCTHAGLSGPLILNSSSEIAELIYDGPLQVTFDIFPNSDQGALSKQFAQLFELNKNKSIKNCLKEVLPAGTAESLISNFSKIDPEKKVHSVTREERTALASTLKKITCTVTGLQGFDKAVVADGGVPLSEIDMKTFASKKYSNLFIIGDLLDIQRPSGGYSLQLCWTSGWVAGNNA
jgi:predicted Rossmann fold flavoprotein